MKENSKGEFLKNGLLFVTTTAVLLVYNDQIGELLREIMDTKSL